MDHFISTVTAATAFLSVDLEAGGVSASGGIAAGATLSATGQVGQHRSATGVVDATGALAADGARGVSASGKVTAAAQVQPLLAADHALRGEVRGTASLRSAPAVDGQGLLVRDAAMAAVSLLHGGGCCHASSLDACLQAAVISQVNASLQVIHGSAQLLGWFSRQTVTLAFGAGETSKVLNRDVQGMHGPVRLDEPRIILREVSESIR